MQNKLKMQQGPELWNVHYPYFEVMQKHLGGPITSGEYRYGHSQMDFVHLVAIISSYRELLAFSALLEILERVLLTLVADMRDVRDGRDV